MAGLNPVDVQITLEPPLTNYMPVNSSATMRVAFVDPVTKQPVQPDLVSFQYTQPPQTTAPTPITPIIDGTGLAHAIVAFAGAPGKWLLQVLAQGNPGPVGVGQGQLQVTVYSTP